MSSINPIGVPNSIAPVAPKAIPKPEAAASSAAPAAPDRVDRLELSSVQSMLNQLKTNDVRIDKVNEIKAQIAAGTYETDEKLDAAADKLLDEVL
ncbi:MAG: flagellar biosynthesis anti-sigma factor FlgM [Burkholderiales bacterium]|nr:flagellar biosynthesis anti-sigma factor FlgM [Phycisphaerae bacterium]